MSVTQNLRRHVWNNVRRRQLPATMPAANCVIIVVVVPVPRHYIPR